MCNVCVADSVISAGEKGYRIRYGKHPAVMVRTRSSEAERGPSEFQLKHEGEAWPNRWTKNRLVLADVMGTFGFDVIWESVPKIVREWIDCVRPVPTIKQIDASRKKEV